MSFILWGTDLEATQNDESGVREVTERWSPEMFIPPRCLFVLKYLFLLVVSNFGSLAVIMHLLFVVPYV